MKKAVKQAHTSNSKIAKGDSFGTGVRNPLVRTIDVMSKNKIPKAGLKKPPRSLA